MARYVMANRRAGKFQAAEKIASRAALESAFNAVFAGNVDVVNDLNPTDALARRVMVLECDPEEVNAKAAQLPADVLFEPEILHYPTVFAAAACVAPLFAPAGPQLSFTAVITGAGAPMRGAEVLLFLVDAANRQTRLTQVTDAGGAVAFSYPAVMRPLGVIVEPAGGFWSMVFRSVPTGATLDCPAIAAVGPLDWWHKQVGIHQFNPQLGAGIKVGVIDTGVGPHGCLAHVVSVGAFINGGHDAAGGADVASHGSHTTGTIGARPLGPNDRAGIAPGVSLFNARVFPSATVGASQADIANALDELSRNRGVDLINMSLGATSPSAIEQDAIKDALERGTLCVCAAGNDGGAVGWPAAFAETVAVSAVGVKNTVPAGSTSATSVPTDPAKIGRARRYLASFSNFGAEVDCCAPGVGIVATVPERAGLVRPYAAMDGTSMASPVSCGALAVLLADSPLYRSLTGAARVAEARAILSAHCQTIGLAATFQGSGMPQVP
jgi:subtilisin family serine protease